MVKLGRKGKKILKLMPCNHLLSFSEKTPDLLLGNNHVQRKYSFTRPDFYEYMARVLLGIMLCPAEETTQREEVCLGWLWESANCICLVLNECTNYN